MLSSLQESLKRSGFDPGRTDGKIDLATFKAVRSFQQAKGLPVDGEGYINMATIRALGATR
jgi:peptidoglycan hydrolase-like protein with peptidoglycan-binding domain